MDEHQRKRAITLALVAASVAVAAHVLRPTLLPYGPAVGIDPRHRPAMAAIDPDDASLRLSGGRLSKICERADAGRRRTLLSGIETIIFDGEGRMYAMNERAELVSLTDFEPRQSDGGSVLTARTTVVADLGPGRPLGGKFDGGGCLYFADAALGLARICGLPPADDPDSPRANVELLASHVTLADGSRSPIAYADDVDVGPRTGHVYFSDGTDVRPDRDPATGLWDFMRPCKVEGLRGKRTGRLLRYRPGSGEVDVLAVGAAFANGVAVGGDEDFVLYTSTADASLMRYPLTGRGAGGAERALDGGLPGLPDGADCPAGGWVCYVAIPTSMPPLIGAIFHLPSWIGAPLRTLLLMLPRALAPKPVPYAAVVEIDPGVDGAPARILRMFQDPDGRDFEMVTGVTEHGGKLYLASLHENCVGVLSLD